MYTHFCMQRCSIHPSAQCVHEKKNDCAWRNQFVYLEHCVCVCLCARRAHHHDHNGASMHRYNYQHLMSAHMTAFHSPDKVISSQLLSLSSGRCRRRDQKNNAHIFLSILYIKRYQNAIRIHSHLEHLVCTSRVNHIARDTEQQLKNIIERNAVRVSAIEQKCPVAFCPSTFTFIKMMKSCEQWKKIARKAKQKKNKMKNRIINAIPCICLM